MSNKHVDNVFYAFRGRSENPDVAERQLEDNLTKAFINTLHYSNGVLTSALMSRIGVSMHSGEASFRYDIQATTPPGLFRGKKLTRVLLGIVSPRSIQSELTTGTRPSSTGRGRPDAWICGPDLLVLVEAKIGAGQLDEEQLHRHEELLREYDLYASDPILKVNVSWSDVYDLVSQALEAPSRESAGMRSPPQWHWIAHQFLNYLEMTNMSGFVGFKRGVFDYFFEPVNDDERSDDMRVVVRDAFYEFADMLLHELSAIDPYFEYVDKGRLERKQDYAWAAFGPAKNLRERAHLTVGLHARGLELKVNIETKPAVDGFRRALMKDPSALRRTLHDLAQTERDSSGKPVDVKSSPRFTVEVEERVQLQASIYKYFPRSKFDVSVLGDNALGLSGFDYFKSLVNEIQLPYVAVKTEVDRTHVELLSLDDRGRALLKHLAAIAFRLHPIVRFANGG